MVCWPIAADSVYETFARKIHAAFPSNEKKMVDEVFAQTLCASAAT